MIDDELYGLHCDIGRLEAENAKLREVASLMAAHYLPNSLRMSPKKWHEHDRLIRDMLSDLKIGAK